MGFGVNGDMCIWHDMSCDGGLQSATLDLPGGKRSRADLPRLLGAHIFNVLVTRHVQHHHRDTNVTIRVLISLEYMPHCICCLHTAAGRKPQQYTSIRHLSYLAKQQERSKQVDRACQSVVPEGTPTSRANLGIHIKECTLF